MNKFCIYKGVKVIKPETWDITSVELSSDYTRAIIQAESKRNKSEYTLDITPLISNQYVDGLDPYSSTIVNELTGVSDWVLDPENNRIVYTQQYGGTDPAMYKDRCIADIKAYLKKYNIPLVYQTANGQMLVERRSDGMACLTYTYYGDSVRTRIATYPITGDDGGQKSLPLETVASQVISNAADGDTAAQEVITSAFNNRVDIILSSDYSEFFEQNKQPK